MNFQDELKANARTQEEIDEAQQQRLNNQLCQDAEKTLSDIKLSMRIKVSNADYTDINGKQVVTTEKMAPEGLRSCINDEYADRCEDETYGFLGQNRRHYIVRDHTLSFKYPDNWQQFFDDLKEIAERDGIEVSPIVEYFDDFSKPPVNIVYQISDFPLTYSNRVLYRNMGYQERELNEFEGGNGTFALFINAVCEVPDHYTSDGFTEVVKSMPEENNPQDIGTFSIDDMDGLDFEGVCADLLSKNGFEDVRITQESGDQGIDIIAHRDGVKYGIQCKSYSSDVGNAAVQQAYAGKDFYKCHVGVVLTNQHFTRSARELAESNGIILWDRDKLIELFRSAGYQVTD